MLFERYRILGVLGQGGMGTVFKGFHVNLKRFVAIKTLRYDRTDSEVLVARFRREMEHIGQMDHPNVVRATDGGEAQGVIYLVMDYLSGSDLSRLVSARGPLGLSDACELIRQAALGLDYIHRTLLHRDIKPSNLMLTRSGVVKILDLGLARYGIGANLNLTPEGCAVGTFSYVAPEQALGGHEVDGRADLYSLGCSLFQLLVGHSPFSGPDYDNAARQLHAHCNVPVSAAPGFDALPVEVKPVLERLLAKNPDERYASGADLAAALAPLAAGNDPLTLLAQVPVDQPVAAFRSSQMMPEELSRLTKVPVETPPHTLAGLADAGLADAGLAVAGPAVVGPADDGQQS
jgi:serine/threonine protein kinase